MNDLIAFVVLIAVVIAAYPLASRLVAGDDGGILTQLLTLALSVGGISLVMLWIGLIAIPFTPISILVLYFSIVLNAGFIRRHEPIPRPRLSLPDAGWQRGVLFLILMVSAASLFNALYFPFYRPDALGIYQPHAQILYQTGGLIPLRGVDSLYLAYPMLIPLHSAFVYLLAGWENEYLAKFLPTIVGLANAAAAFVLAQERASIRSKPGEAYTPHELSAYAQRVAWIAALLIAFIPAFARWAAAGYVDLPMAFFYTMTAIFVLRLWREGRVVDAALAGAILGLAAMTKNAALLGVPLLAVALMVGVWRRQFDVKHAVICAATCALIGAPWYIRNLVGAGFLIPDTAWVDQAPRDFSTLFIWLTQPEYFGVPGILILLTLPIAIVRFMRAIGRGQSDFSTAKLGHLLLWTMPFYAAWWLFVSYDPRFILLFAPILCALAAGEIVTLLTRFPAGMPVRSAATILAGGVAFLIALQITYVTVEYKNALIRDPFMTHEEKLIVVGRGDEMEE